MDKDKDEAIYPISVVSKLVNLSTETIRSYEEDQLIKPDKTEGGKRLYSQNDIDWIKHIHYVIHDQKLGVKCIQKLLEVFYCYEIKDCTPEDKEKIFGIKQKKQWDLMKKNCEKLFFEFKEQE